MAEKTYTEPSRKLKVIREVDVVVVGGGPGGVASAICAARNGAKTVLIERYGHLGGMASGGLVNIFPNLSDISGKQHIAGITQEIIDRMTRRGAWSYPPKEDWGVPDTKSVDHYVNANMGFFFVRGRLNRGGKKVVLYSAVVDPEILKGELNDMVAEAGVELFLHSWGTQPIVDNGVVKGVIFESKSGRQAIMGKIIIDATGDGDIFVRAGAEFDAALSNKRRTAWLSSNWWMANVDIKKYDEFRKGQPEKCKELNEELVKLGGYAFFFKGVLKNQEGVLWYHSMQPQAESTDAMDVEQLTRVDVKARKRTMITHDFVRKYMPGFEKCFIMQVAPQLGTQGGRRVIGEHTLTLEDIKADRTYEDTIAVLANNDLAEISAKHPWLNVPYRCLVPKKVDGLLVACRAFSSEDDINEYFNIIPYCLIFGQAAGTAAAMAVKKGIEPRKVDYKALQKNLLKQGANLG
jgi:hypothetical protein